MEDDKIKIVDDLQPVGAGKQELPYMKMEDAQYFSKLLEDVDEEALPPEEQKERKIMRLLLKIKNGTPPMRKVGGQWMGGLPEESRECSVQRVCEAAPLKSPCSCDDPLPSGL